MHFTILGEPMAKQSCRFTRKGIRFQPKAITDNSNSLKYQIIQQLPMGFKPFDIPLEIDYKFYYAYPKALKQTKANKLKIQLGQLFYKHTKPDIDNLQKQINDAMNSVVFLDDSRIVKISAEKLYAEIPRMEIEVTPIT